MKNARCAGPRGKAVAIHKSLAAGTDPTHGGATVDELAAQHERTRAGIEARLVKHVRLEAEQAPGARLR